MRLAYEHDEGKANEHFCGSRTPGGEQDRAGQGGRTTQNHRRIAGWKLSSSY